MSLTTSLRRLLLQTWLTWHKRNSRPITLKGIRSLTMASFYLTGVWSRSPALALCLQRAYLPTTSMETAVASLATDTSDCKIVLKSVAYSVGYSVFVVSVQLSVAHSVLLPETGP